MILAVASTTFVVQLLGPLFAKLGVKKAGKNGMNVRGEDLTETYRVGDVMDARVPVIPAGMPLEEVVQFVSRTDGFYYSLVNAGHEIIGAITLHGIRNTFATQELDSWHIAPGA